MRGAIVLLFLGCAAALSAGPSPCARPTVASFRRLPAGGERGLALRGGKTGFGSISGYTEKYDTLREEELDAREWKVGESRLFLVAVVTEPQLPNIPRPPKSWKDWKEFTLPNSDLFLTASALAFIAVGSLCVTEILPFSLPLLSTLQKHNVLATLFSGGAASAQARKKADMKLLTPLLGLLLVSLGELIRPTINKFLYSRSGVMKTFCQASAVTWGLACLVLGAHGKLYSAAGCAVMALAGRNFGWAKDDTLNPAVDMDW